MKKICIFPKDAAQLISISENGFYCESPGQHLAPLHEQIVEFRLLNALKQLLTSNMQVQEVAELLGYNPNISQKPSKNILA